MWCRMDLMDTALQIRVELAISGSALIHYLLTSEAALYKIGKELFESKDRKMVTDICSVFKKGDNTTKTRTFVLVAYAGQSLVKSIDTRLQKAKVWDGKSVIVVNDRLDEITELAGQLLTVSSLRE